MMIPAVTESVIEYGNVFVPEDQGTLKDSALIASRPQDGLAIWDTPYAKRRDVYKRQVIIQTARITMPGTLRAPEKGLRLVLNICKAVFQTGASISLKTTGLGIWIF